MRAFAAWTVAAWTAGGERCRRLRSEESGQGLVEYGFILVLVSVVCVLALTNLGQSLTAIITQAAQDI
jgi:Flp pilus assembly pilin Flp